MRFVTLALRRAARARARRALVRQGRRAAHGRAEGKLEAQKATNEAARQRNEQLAAEVQRPEGRPRDGRGEGALRARHDQARRDLRPALDAAALNAGGPRWLARGRLPLFAQRLRRSGARRSPGSRSSPSSSRIAMVVLQHPRQPARLAAGDRQLAALLLLFWKSRLYGDASCRSSSPRSRCWGWWQWLRGTDRPTGAARVRRLGVARALDRARRARARLAGDRPLPRPLHRHRRALVGRVPDRGERASASGCSAASTSRTGRSGSSSTSSASACSPTRVCG